ncbi:MAG: hypothetical protein A2V90_00290 [Gammaproteobacteria bacterium RBG_16_57_12]|nr:MAG: hypothetical protein A2V90_00290 [Gammaproteobacteria bacterium RBG_16_57_12]
MMKLSPGKFLIGCIVLASLIAGLGHVFYVGRDDLAQLIASCNEQNQIRQQERQGKTCARDDLNCLWKQASLVCQPEQLRDVSESTDTIQSQIKVKAQQVASRTTDVNVVAILVALVGTAPAIWYFGLARIREVGNAVRGR